MRLADGGVDRKVGAEEGYREFRGVLEGYGSVRLEGDRWDGVGGGRAFNHSAVYWRRGGVGVKDGVRDGVSTNG